MRALNGTSGAARVSRWGQRAAGRAAPDPSRPLGSEITSGELSDDDGALHDTCLHEHVTISKEHRTLTDHT